MTVPFYINPAQSAPYRPLIININNNNCNNKSQRVTRADHMCSTCGRHFRAQIGLFSHLQQPCQNVPVAGNFAAFSQFLAAYSTLDFTRNPRAGTTWSLLPTTPSILPTATVQIILTGLLQTHKMYM